MSHAARPTEAGVATWRQTDAGNQLLAGNLTAGLDPAHLCAGLSELRCGEALLADRVFAAKTPGGPLPHAIESYVRGADHVSTHPAADAFPFRTQLDWTAEELGNGTSAAVLTVSLQTDLLDTRPELLFTTLPTGSPVEGPFAGWRFETPGTPTLLLVPHPTDAGETQRVQDDHAFGLRLASPFLEKGVIRRFRLAAIALAADATEEDVHAALEGFTALPLPLTT